METKATLEIIGLVLGIVALVLAVFHSYEIRTQAIEIRGTANDLKSISDTLPTRHIGQFPDYLGHIAGLVASAKKTVTVLCDFPAYGSFSAPDAFLDYHQALERLLRDSTKERRVTVTLTCLAAPHRLELIKEQFSKEHRQWSDWRHQPASRAKLERLIERRNRKVSVDHLSFESLVEFLEDENVRSIEELFAGATVRTVSTYVPLYFWLVDEKEAVFALPSFSDRSTEYGFYTRDSALIAGFMDVLNRYHRQIEALH